MTESLNNSPGKSESSRLSELHGRVYKEMRQLAEIHMKKEKYQLTLQPTALIHEAWLRLGGDQQQEWKSKGEFFASAAESMRRILVDRARRKKAVKHGGHLQSVVVDDWDEISDGDPESTREDDKILALHEALERLAIEEPKIAELVKLHYFAGLTHLEASEVLDVSERTAQRWLSFARTWLGSEMEEAEEPPL